MYWDSVGQEHTEKTLELALARARELSVGHIVVASTRGKTATMLLEKDVEGMNIVVVGHEWGFRSPGENELTTDVRNALERAGASVLTTTHLFAGLNRALRLKFDGIFPSEIVSFTLRTFGEGTKVALEIASMALDAGLIPHGERIVSIGGSNRGADTALLMLPAHARNFFDTRVLEIICKPGQL
jgi:hypothetical protein